MCCSKYKRNMEVKIQELPKLVIEKQCFYQNVQCIIIENQDLSKNKNPADFLVNQESKFL